MGSRSEKQISKLTKLLIHTADRKTLPPEPVFVFSNCLFCSKIVRLVIDFFCSAWKKTTTPLPFSGSMALCAHAEIPQTPTTNNSKSHTARQDAVGVFVLL